jgi:starch phosphorylase
VPVVAIGLLYQQGYFRQELDANGSQESLFPFNDPGQLPIQPVRDARGEWLRLSVPMPGLKVWIRAWKVRVGRITLYLLDSNDPANPPAMRAVTSDLYGGGPETRLRQEFVLGIGGWRLLRMLGLHPEVCHLNEGHAAFVVLARARSFMEEHKQPFETAFSATRAGNIFTTHTAVEAGFDRFHPDLITKYLRHYSEDRLNLPLQRLLALGRRDGNDNTEPFNMAFLALRGSGAVNGVSRLHAQVSRRLFQPLFPRWPEHEVPVGHVTNGIHGPTWESPSAHKFWTDATAQARWFGDLENMENDIRSVSDEALWALRSESCTELVAYVRQHLARQRAIQGASPEEIANAERVFSCDVLTLGFARRFATYKRPNLLLHDPTRLIRILTNRERPVQLILAGKAHPEDRAGQELVRQWSEFIRRPEARGHVVFLSDYDMRMGQQLVQGVDVWINTPRRPWEASGTSGMKVLVNGGLNLSELDGWWAEAYAPEVGWAIGDGREHDHDTAWDQAEAEHLYELLEQEVVPAFYTRDERGISRSWIAKMRESLARLAPHFSANRTVREYTESYYLPAAAEYRRRADDGARFGVYVADRQRKLEAGWPRVAFDSVRVHDSAGEFVIEARVHLGELEPDDVQVEIYADPDFRRTMMRRTPFAGGYEYSLNVPADRPAAAYTVRIIAEEAGLRVPLEAKQILWQK